jgi:hypothetical protein
MIDDRKPFTYTVRSYDRITGGTVVAYSVTNVREVLGDWKVTVRTSPFAVNAANTTVEMQIRAGGVTSYSSDFSLGWTSVLTMCPGATGGSTTDGVFIVNGGFRGPFDLRWWDSANTTLCTATNFKEHVINMYFEPI